jgi:hypothetical protein
MRNAIAAGVLLVVIFALAAGVTINANNISDNFETNKVTVNKALVLTCLGSAQRGAQQLKVDWAIYTADKRSAVAYFRQGRHAKFNGKLIKKQGEIRLSETKSLYAAMVKIASTRIDVSVAPLLPVQLAAAVLRTNFRCSQLTTTKVP